ncbi:MAG: hypothetical protein V4592_17360 [Bacteroidota bacterium]
MKLYYKLFFTALFFSTLSFAQSNFKPGYVVTLPGDTLKGSIDYKEWNNNPEDIRFKDNANKITTYSAINAKAFGINGLDYFKAYKISLSMDEVDQGKLKNQYDSTKLIGTVFLKTIIDGKYLTLYTYTDDIKTRFIVLSKENKQPQELNHHFYLNNSNQVMEIDRYKIELKSYADTYMPNSEKLHSKIDAISYNSSDITKVVNLINGDDQKKGVIGSESSFRYFAGAALNGSQLKYSGITDLSVNSQNYINYFPQINLGIDYLPNANVGRLILRGELNFYSAKLKSVSNNAVKEMQQLTLTVSPQVIYNVYNTQPVKIFVGSGFLLHLSSNSNVTYNVINPHFTVPVNQKKPASAWFTIPVKAGISLNNKVEIYGNYNFAAGFDEDSFAAYNGKITSFQIGFNYLFGKK